MSRNSPWKFDVYNTSKFALEASLLMEIFVLRTSNFRGETISLQFLDRNTPLFKQKTIIQPIKFTESQQTTVNLYKKETENVFSVFLLNYRNTLESSGELENAVKTILKDSFLVLSNFHPCFYYLIETRYKIINSKPPVTNWNLTTQ